MRIAQSLPRRSSLQVPPTHPSRRVPPTPTLKQPGWKQVLRGLCPAPILTPSTAICRGLILLSIRQTAATASQGRGCSQTLNKAKQLSNSSSHKNYNDNNTVCLKAIELCPLSYCTQQTA